MACIAWRFHQLGQRGHRGLAPSLPHEPTNRVALRGGPICRLVPMSAGVQRFRCVLHRPLVPVRFAASYGIDVVVVVGGTVVVVVVVGGIVVVVVVVGGTVVVVVVGGSVVVVVVVGGNVVVVAAAVVVVAGAAVVVVVLSGVPAVVVGLVDPGDFLIVVVVTVPPNRLVVVSSSDVDGATPVVEVTAAAAEVVEDSPSCACVDVVSTGTGSKSSAVAVGLPPLVKTAAVAPPTPIVRRTNAMAAARRPSRNSGMCIADITVARRGTGSGGGGSVSCSTNASTSPSGTGPVLMSASMMSVRRWSKLIRPPRRVR